LNNKNISIIIQARTGSTRLPNKIFKPLAGEPVLWHVYNRVKHSSLISQIVVATTDLPEDDAVEKFCIENNISNFRGSSENVLSRYYYAAKRYNAEIIIRITADCPVIDPVILDKIITAFKDANKNDKLDYMSNSIIRTFPRGLDAEIFSMEVLDKTFNEATQKYELEHVTPYIYQHPEIFAIKNFGNDKNYSQYRWTVDTKEDYELLCKIYDALYHQKEIFLFEDILKLFEEHPELSEINKDIEQKKLGE
jgi:spore coat polysaccharide biosynthesis protein SpsF